MRTINLPILQDYVEAHAEARAAMATIKRLMLGCTADNLPALRQTFRHCDQVHNDNGADYYVFNAGGNNYRVIAHIDFGRQSIRLLHVMSHREYDRWNRRIGR